MKHKLLRGLVALVLVCCMIVNCIAIKAEASVLGGTALALFGDDAIAVIAVCLIGLGVMADTASQTSMLEFRYLCDQAYDAMAAAGEWVVDGAVTVYNCATELWDYGIDCGMVQWLHEWLYDSADVLSERLVWENACLSPCYESCMSYVNLYADNTTCIAFINGENWGVVWSNYECNISYNEDRTSMTIGCSVGGRQLYVKSNFGYTDCNATSIPLTGYYASFGTSSPFENEVEYFADDLVLGQLAPPGTEIETEYGEYIVIVAPNGVPDAGGDGSGDDEQPQIPIIPVPIMPSYDDTIQLPQEDIWKGNKVETEDPDTGGSTDPTTGTDTDSDTGTDTDGRLSNTPWETFKKWISTGWESTIQAIPTPDSIAEAVGNVIKSIFVPDADFISEKWNDIRSRFEFADSITATGEVLVDILDGLDPEPPVIYIDLGATEGSYNIGGEVPFIDLRWYARYKPTMDLIISAFLWLAFVWRLILKLPGIISGMPGEFVLMNLPVNLPHLGIGSSQRREELESGRNNRRLGDGH